MGQNRKQRTRVMIESLENRALFSASSALTVTPPANSNANAAPAAAHVAPQGCDNGIGAHAQGASNGVVACQGTD